MLHCTEKGSIMRTGTVPSFEESFLPLGTKEGSKSAGMYLLRTLRSPMVNSDFGWLVELDSAGAEFKVMHHNSLTVNRFCLDLSFIAIEHSITTMADQRLQRSSKKPGGESLEA